MTFAAMLVLVGVSVYMLAYTLACTELVSYVYTLPVLMSLLRGSSVCACVFSLFSGELISRMMQWAGSSDPIRHVSRGSFS